MDAGAFGVNADGTFQLNLDPAVKDGSTLQVVLTDAAGNASTHDASDEDVARLLTLAEQLEAAGHAELAGRLA